MKHTESDADAAEARRRARASWTVRVFQPGEEQAAAVADALFWDAVPVAERAALVWQLSREMYELAFPGAENERRLPRSAFCVVRR